MERSSDRLPAWGGGRPAVARDALLAAMLGAAAFVLYAATLQDRLYGDGWSQLSIFVHDESPFRARNPHVFYTHLLEAAAPLRGLGTPDLVPRLLSAAAGAIAVAATFVLARGLGARRAPALVACGLLALAPATWFFATTIEVHAAHSCAVALCACVALFAPWRRFALALALVALTFPLAFLTHASGVLLGPGWVALVGVAAARQGVRLPARRLLFVVGPVLLAALVVALAWSSRFRTGSWSPWPREEVRMLGFWARGPSWSALRSDWIEPLGLLLAAAVAGAIAGRRDRARLAALAVLVVPSTVFFVAWGMAERGGYHLSTAPFVAVLAALAPWPSGALARALVVVPALAFQATLSRTAIRAWDDGTWGAVQTERAARVEAALGSEGVLFSFVPGDQAVYARLPGVMEHKLDGVVQQAADAGMPPATFCDNVLAVATAVVASGVPVAFDRSYARYADDARLGPYLTALDEGLAARFALEHHPHDAWPIAELRPR